MFDGDKSRRKSMAVGSSGFQARPNLCQVALFEDASQLSKASGIVSKAKSHLVAICSQLGLHSGFGDIEPEHRQRGRELISG